ncbi:hypothetical protein VitviT2T_004616 [Vitis vinifera]|nr:lachrymatory-factor synthase [Vitis vinifera]RVW17232.1 Lachrymatory-factor synthase [Vitis vinifera]WJZ85051.1 hypothetical protein VitviT2T_004616 [Vitis vinifera]|eukprot:XP_002281101.1 PREDICTED: lachrymatory-factor synthase [Vitis vinifera]
MEEPEPRWEGKATAELKTTAPDQVWPLLEDFCGIHKWFPDLDTSYQVEGEKGKPGLTRYCANNPGESGVKWAKEKLLTMDPIQRCFSYEVLDNNIGFNSYVATIKVLPVDGGGCRIEWSFASGPIEGWRSDDLGSFVDSCLQFMAKKMEAAIKNEDGSSCG